MIDWAVLGATIHTPLCLQNLFRRVGTSHICVTDLHNKVLGVVTRQVRRAHYLEHQWLAVRSFSLSADTLLAVVHFPFFAALLPESVVVCVRHNKESFIFSLQDLLVRKDRPVALTELSVFSGVGCLPLCLPFFFEFYHSLLAVDSQPGL